MERDAGALASVEDGITNGHHIHLFHELSFVLLFG
jgi:hypothetical protein